MLIDEVFVVSCLFLYFRTLYCSVPTISDNKHYSDQYNEYMEICCQSINLGESFIKESTNNIARVIMCPKIIPLTCSETVNGSSCADILHQYPSAVSDYYNIILYNGSVVSVYCDMEGDKCDGEGGWTRIGYLNMTQPNATCPTGLTPLQFANIDHDLCGKNSSNPYYEGCQSAYYPSLGLNYTKVCGQVRRYKYRYPEGFYCTKKNIENAYVYGVSITKDSPRQHIWTYAAGDNEYHYSPVDCPCNSGHIDEDVKPQSIGNDYYCESTPSYGDLDASDALWDGEQCNGLEGPCCNSNKLPWFVKTLEESNDDIEVRVCSCGLYENVPIDILEIFIK